MRVLSTLPSNVTRMRVNEVAGSCPRKASASTSRSCPLPAAQKNPTLSRGAVLIATIGVSLPTKCEAQSSVPSHRA